MKIYNIKRTERIMLRYIFLVLFILFFTSISCEASAETDTRIKNFIEDINSTELIKKETRLAYWNGVMDTTMNFGTLLKALCFPSPMPTRIDFLRQFIEDIETYKMELGAQKVAEMQIDQFLGLTWKKRYACPVQ